MLRATILMVAIGVLAACADGSDTPSGYSEGVQPLAKVEGWRSDLDPAQVSFGLVEVAYDRDTAEQAWGENVPEGLGEGDPAQGEVGRFGTVDDVDFSDQALVVWHSGESGSCPAWLADIGTDGEPVTIERDEYVPGDGCTDDYNPYRMVLVIDRDRLPEPEHLPTDDVAIDSNLDGRISTYPDDGGANQGG